MAITRINDSGANNLNPGYNNLTYYFTSTNKANKGFRYVAKIKDRLNNLLFEKTIIPSISTGDCHLQIDNEISDYLNYTFDISKINMANYEAVESYQDFKIEMGEEFFYEYNWNEYIYVDDNSPYWPRGSNPAYNPGLRARTAIVTSSDSAPLFNVGDWIYINQPVSNSVTKPIGGSKKILDIVNLATTISGVGYVGWAIVLDMGWVGSSSTNGGTVRYDDNRKTRTSNLLVVDKQAVYNGYINSKDFIDYNQEDYLMTINSGETKALTTLPEK